MPIEYISDDLAIILDALHMNKGNIKYVTSDGIIILDNGYKLQDMGYEWAYYHNCYQIPEYIKKSIN